MSKTTTQIVSDNIKTLRDTYGISVNRMAECGITARALASIMNEGVSPKVESVGKIANFFKIPTWLLLVEGITAEDIRDMKINHIVKDYIKCDTEGRKSLLRQAHREAFLSKKVPPPPRLTASTDTEKSN